jgi:hypothetical protein
LARVRLRLIAFGRGTPADAINTFKHSLVQDAAYDSMLKSRRQELHAKITRAIKARLPSGSRRPNPSCWRITSPPQVLVKPQFRCGRRLVRWR